MSTHRAEPAIHRDFPHYGDICDVNLEPVIGSETGKLRPALVVSNNIDNEYAAY